MLQSGSQQAALFQKINIRNLSAALFGVFFAYRNTWLPWQSDLGGLLIHEIAFRLSSGRGQKRWLKKRKFRRQMEE